MDNSDLRLTVGDPKARSPVARALGRWSSAARSSRPVRVTAFVVLTVAACAGAVALALLVVLPAVTGKPLFGGGPGAAPAAPAATQDPYNPPRVQIAQAYRQYNRVQLRTARTNNPAPLDEVLTGRALDMHREAYAQREQAGKVGYGTRDLDILSISINGARATRATVHACDDGSEAGLKNARTGEILTVGRERQEAYVKMRRAGGEWKVALIQTVKGGGDCA